MNVLRNAASLCLFGLSLPLCHAAVDGELPDPPAKVVVALPLAAGESAGNPPLPEAPRAGAVSAAISPRSEKALKTGATPFSSVAIALKLGLGGAGFDIAVPLASKLNLRVGGSFFSYNPNLDTDGITITGNIQLRSINEAFDFFPFGNAFRISPGVIFYNGNHINAAATVAGGNTFSLNGASYISSPSDPVHGTFDLSFGNQLAPSLTMGFGNMIPRHGGHWSVPFEIGVEYLGRQPRIALTLGGSACFMSTQPGYCQPIQTDPQTQQNVQLEQNDLNNNIPAALRFYPIASIGLSYKFGRR